MILDLIFDINKIWYGIADALLQIVNALNAVFYWFAGILPPSSMNLGESASGATGGNFVNAVNEESLLYSIFSLDGIGSLFLFFMAIGIACLGIALAVGLVKTSFAKDQPDAKKKLLGKSLSSLFWIVAMPCIFLVLVLCVNAVMNLIVYACGISTGSAYQTLGDVIGNACINGQGQGEFTVGMSYDVMSATVGGSDNFNYLLCILSCSCIVVGLFLSIFTVIERMIHIVFLYIVSPVVLAKTPLDDGKSFGQWVEMCFTKFLSVAGVVVCMYLFFMIMPMITAMFDSVTATSGWHSTALSIAKICFVVGGAFTFTKAGTLFAHLVSSSAGQFEGMSMGQSTAMLGMGARLGMGLMSKGLMGARMGMVGGGKAGGAGGAGMASALTASGMGAGGMTGYGAKNIGGIATASPMSTAMATSRASGAGGMGAGMAFAYGGIAGGIGAGIGKAVRGVGGLAVKGVKKGAGAIGNIKGSNGLTFRENRAINKASKYVSSGKAVKDQGKARTAEIKQRALQMKRLSTINEKMGKDFDASALNDKNANKLQDIKGRYSRRPTLNDIAGDKKPKNDNDDKK